MDIESEIAGILLEVEAAPLDPDKWFTILPRIGGLVGAHAMSLEWLRADPPSCRSFGNMNFGEQFEREYMSHYVTLNPRVPRALGARVGRVLHDLEVFDDTAMDRDAYFTWIEAMADARYCAYAKLHQGRDSFLGVSFHRSRQHGAFDMRELSILESLMPYLSNAAMMSTRMSRDSSSVSGLEYLDHAGLGAALLDVAGKILSTNKLFDAILSASDGLSTQHGGLSAARPEDDAALYTLISNVLAQSEIKIEANVPSFAAVQRTNGKRPYVVRVVRVAENGPFFAECYPGALLLVHDPDRLTTTNAAEMLGSIFGLSPRQARLASLLAKGLTVADCSRMLSISEHTVRSHVKEIFRRTGVHSLQELASLLSRYAVMMP